jgi:3-hydroxyisobutyrate dehydrogenase-like beta-hydroxyacid dehydrogenase
MTSATVSTVSTTVGFIGIGKMGLPMVTHLRTAGYHVIVCDPVHANVEAARLLGCEGAETVGGCASQADILFSSLPNDASLAAITSGADSIFAHSKRGMPTCAPLSRATRCPRKPRP